MQLKAVETKPRAWDGSDSWRVGTIEVLVHPGQIKGIYLYCCEKCGKTVRDDWPFFGTTMNPNTPYGWTRIQKDGGESYYCDRHTVTQELRIEDK